MARLGVFICWCGANIAETVDCEAVAQYAAGLPGVVVGRSYKYMCSDPGQRLITDAIQEHKLTGAVVASCSPRMHEPTFRKTAATVGHEPLHARDGQHPRALLLGPPQPARGHREGQGPGAPAGGEGQAQRAAPGDRGPRHAARHGHRRRHRRHPGRPGRGQRRLRGGPGGAQAQHRRPHGHARRDLPHPGLLAVHPDPPHGRDHAEQQDQALRLQRGGPGRRLRGQLQGEGAPEGPQRGHEEVHRLRRLLEQLHVAQQDHRAHRDPERAPAGRGREGGRHPRWLRRPGRHGHRRPAGPPGGVRLPAPGRPDLPEPEEPACR